MGIRVDNANDAAVATLTAVDAAEAVVRAAGDTAIHAVYKTLIVRNAIINDAQTSATRVVVPSGAVVASTASTIAATSTFAINTTELAVSGLTTKLNLQVSCLTNATAVGTCTFTFGLYPVSGTAGATDTSSVTLGAVTSGSTVAFVNPSASTITTSTSGDFTCPSTGHYVLGLLNSATPSADSFASFSCILRYRHV